jgi:hypothetical protein
MKPLFDSSNQPKMHHTINSIIKELSSQHEGPNSAYTEQDIVALFEDILRFFIGKEDEFKHLEDMSKSEKEALYTEINLIIDLFKRLKTKVDRDIAIDTLSERLVKAFCKNPEKYAFLSKSQMLSELERERVREEFARNTTHILLEKQKLLQKGKVKAVKHARLASHRGRHF